MQKEINMPPRNALIIGISGQDGAYLAKLLLAEGYTVFGTSRDAQVSKFSNLQKLHIQHEVSCLSANPSDFRSLLSAIRTAKPTEIYNLAGQSSVALSFEQPVETFNSICIANLNILEAIRFLDPQIKYYNAGSSECFGNTIEPATEATAFHPRSPYGVAKAAAFWQGANYRDSYNLFACSGILFNHESPLRPERFVTQKIVRAAYRIASGTKEKLLLGNLDIERDWGLANDYVRAMWLMLQQDKPDDFIIASGQTHSLKTFVSLVFNEFNLNWEEHVTSDPQLFRPSDILTSKASPEKAHARLGWTAKHNFQQLIHCLVQGEIQRNKNVG